MCTSKSWNSWRQYSVFIKLFNKSKSSSSALRFGDSADALRDEKRLNKLWESILKLHVFLENMFGLFKFERKFFFLKIFEKTPWETQARNSKNIFRLKYVELHFSQGDYPPIWPRGKKQNRDFSWLRMTSDTSVTSDDFEWLQMTSNDFEWLQMTSDDFR